MLSSMFRCIQWLTQTQTQSWWMLLVGVTVLVGLVPQHTNGLECYECKHGDNPLPTVPINPECINPATSTNPINKTTCANPAESCIKWVGFGKPFTGGNLTLLTRGCFLPKSGQAEPDTCKDFTGTAFYVNKTVEFDRKSMDLGTWAAILDSDQFKDQKAKASLLDLRLVGKYCICNKDLCNDAPGMEVGFIAGSNPNSTTTTPGTGEPDPATDQSPVEKSIPRLIFALGTFAYLSFLRSAFLPDEVITKSEF